MSRIYYNMSAQLINTATPVALNSLTALSVSAWVYFYAGALVGWLNSTATAADAYVTQVMFSAVAGQTAAVVQHVNYNFAANALTQTVSITPTAGNDLVLCDGNFSVNAITGISDNQNGAWTKVAAGPSDNAGLVTIWAVHNVKGLATTITITYAASAASAGSVAEVSHLTGATYFGSLCPASGTNSGIEYQVDVGKINSGFWYPSAYCASTHTGDIAFAVIAESSTIAIANQSGWTELTNVTNTPNASQTAVAYAALDMTQSGFLTTAGSIGGYANRIVSKPSSPAGTDDYFVFQIEGPETAGGTSLLRLYCGRVTTPQRYQCPWPSSALNGWHHVAVTCSDCTVNSGAAVSLYIDGVAQTVTTQAGLGAALTDLGDIVVGSDLIADPYSETGPDTNLPSSFWGSLADVCIWNRAITSAEVNQARMGGPPSSGLVGRWMLTGTDSPELDSSGNGTSLTVNGVTSGVPGNISIAQGSALLRAAPQIVQAVWRGAELQ